MHEDLELMLLGVACKHFESGQDCYKIDSFKENPMDDYVLLLIKTYFLILFDSYDMQYNCQLYNLNKKVIEMEQRHPYFITQRFINTLNKCKKKLTQLRSSKNPIPIAIDISLDLRQDWITKRI
jgi:hypothetical protein